MVVKHAAPVVDPGVPRNLWRLSDEGRHRSAVLARRLEGYELGVVVSSAKPKAVETAEVVAGRLCVGQRVVPGLHEHDRTGAPFGTREEFGRSARDFFENPEALVWGNETAVQARDRFAGAVRSVLAEHPEANLAVVAHGTVNTLFLTSHAGIDPYGFWRGLGLPSFYVLSLPGFGLQEVVKDVEV